MYKNLKKEFKDTLKVWGDPGTLLRDYMVENETRDILDDHDYTYVRGLLDGKIQSNYITTNWNKIFHLWELVYLYPDVSDEEVKKLILEVVNYVKEMI